MEGLVIDARTYRCPDINSNHKFLLAIIKLKGDEESAGTKDDEVKG